MFIAQTNENFDAIIFDIESSVCEQYLDCAIEIDVPPIGIGILKCDSTKYWYEPFPEPEVMIKIPTFEEDLLQIVVDQEYRLTLLELGVTI